MATNINQLKTKVTSYQEVLTNTENYRQEWHTKVKDDIKQVLQAVIVETGLKGKVVENNEMENLEMIMLDMGRSSSGIAQNRDNTDIKNFMIKNNGAIIFQQLFNGKIMVMINSPFIEGYGEPKEPQYLQILRPAEINDAIIYGHVETLLDTITEWQDFDDDSPQEKTVFQPIGFQHTVNLNNENGNNSSGD